MISLGKWFGRNSREEVSHPSKENPSLLRFTIINLQSRCEGVAMATRNSSFSSLEKRCYVLPIIPPGYLSQESVSL
ncbi:hypothetical protein HNY73_010666 [Argiope bruennichi]|uniref:Uncharacterized protein n=1 Tax=Argiope bruennichi TaxID=94029 RepID=A0A8T0F3P4_ARGBR|nr:hypothetical protein HNY73_010666 [Argiope bruennichi]